MSEGSFSHVVTKSMNIMQKMQWLEDRVKQLEEENARLNQAINNMPLSIQQDMVDELVRLREEKEQLEKSNQKLSNSWEDNVRDL